MAILKNTIVNDTGFVTLPKGTTAQRGIYTFTGPGSWTCPAGVTSVRVLVVAGGGAGGQDYAGGGGGGGVVFHASYPVTPTTSYPITVGTGGARPTTSGAIAGNPSNFNGPTGLVALGGGGGG
jgi:hypothetical protein